MMWVGDERFLLLLAEDPDLAVAMIEQHNRYRLEHALKSLAAGGGRIDQLHGGGDYSSQNGLLISPRMFRRAISKSSTGVSTVKSKPISMSRSSFTPAARWPS